MRGYIFILICAFAITKGKRIINGYSDPSKAFEICAAEESIGLLVAHENCNKFYTCSQGKPVTIRCPSGLLYNPRDQVCDWPQNVECGDRIIPNPNYNGGSEESDGGDYNTDDNGSNNNGNDNDVDGNHDDGIGAGNCNPSEAPKICAVDESDGVLVAHEKCNKFYKCDQRKPVPIRCPGSLLFNPAKDVCDWPKNVECGDRIMPDTNDNSGCEDNGTDDVETGDNGDDDDDNDNDDDGTTDNGNHVNGNGAGNCDPNEAPKICAAEESNGILVAHEKCNKYYKCDQNKPIPIRCPDGLLFNPAKDICDWPENVDCGDRIIPDPNGNEGSGDSDNEDDGTDDSGGDSNGNDNGNNDNGNQDNGNGVGNCDPNKAPKICAAEESNGILVAHEKCNKYYKCDQSKPVSIRCPGGLLFNPAKDVCDWPENVDCGDRIIPDPNGNEGSEDSDNEDDGTNDIGGESNGNDNGTTDNGNQENGNGAGNCDPNEAPKICAAKESNGILVAHEKCYKYYKCAQNTPIAIRCPDGLLFNPAKDVCDWPENVDCGDRIIPDPNGNEGSEDSDNEDDGTDDSGGDSNGNDNGTTDNGNQDNGNGAGNCDPNQAPKICAAEESNGILVAHEKCNKYYKCDQSKPVTIRCPGGLLFNPAKDVCDWPENVDCGDRIIPDPNGNEGNEDSDNEDDGTNDIGGDSNGNNNGTTDNGNQDNGNGAGNCDPNQAPKICAAEESNGILVAHEKCNKYYKCDQSKPVTIRCPGGLLFNPAKNVCDWPENVDCGDRIIPDPNGNEGSEDSDNEDDGTDDSGGDSNGNNNGTTDNGNQDNANGAGNCDPNEAPKICAAEESNGILVAHEKCNKYYKCDQSKPVTIRCPGGLLFNPAKDVCDWPENVDCGDRIIPDPNGNEGNEDSDNEDDGTNDIGGGSNGNNNGTTDNGNQDNGNGAGNCDPNQAPKICAAEESNGILVAHEKCNKYYKCDQSKPVTIRCPGGLLFNPAKNVCDWPENVDCGDRIIPDPNGNEGSEDSDNEDDGTDDSGGDSNGNNNGTTDNGNQDNANGAGNCDPNEAPKICAAEESNGILVAHEKCNKYYKCDQSQPITISCPGGLLFNPAKDVCDWPENVDCGDRIIPDPNGNEGSEDSDNEDDGTDDSGGDSNGNDNGNNDNGNQDNGNGAGNCDPNEAPKICAAEESNGILVAHEKCHKYYKCDQSKPVTIRCPGGLLFNPAKDVCDWPENVDCGDRIIPDPNGNEGSEDSDNEDDGTNDSGGDSNGNDNGTTDNGNQDNGNGAGNCDPNEAPKICAAEESNGILVAHEKCYKYYKCAQNTPIAIRCPDGLLFNPAKDVCDWPENVDCGDRTIPDTNGNEGSEDSDNEDDGADDSEGDSNGNDNGTTDNGNHDNGNGAGNCDPNKAPKICAAEESNGILVAHEKCNKYYKCDQRTPIPIRCPGGLLFNPAKDVCDWPENVDCGERIIPDLNDNESSENNDDNDDITDDNGGDNNGNDNGDNGTTDDGNHDNGNGSCNCKPEEAPQICDSERSDGVLVAHEKCNKFYTCSLGKPITIKCPSGLLYNPWDQVCDWPQNVECGDRIIPDPNDNAESEDSQNGDIGTDDSGSNNNSNENGDNSNNDNDSGSCNCNPSEAPQICALERSDGSLVAHEKCNKFYTCSQGKPVTIKCPSGLLYNPKDQVCDWPENVECGDRIIPNLNDNSSDENNENGDIETGDNGGDDNSNGNGDNDNNDNGNSTCNCNPGEAPRICASERSDGLLVAHEKCNKFYTCSLGKPITIKCPSGLLYNPQDQVCDWPQNVECGDRIIPDPNDNAESEDSQNGDIGTDDSGNNNNSNENGDNSNNDNGSGSCNCNPSEAPQICASERSDGSLVAHEKCNKFYTCSQGKPVTTKCSSGLLYNPKDQVCDWPENVECGDRIIPDLHDNASDENSENGDVETGDNGSDNNGNGNGDNNNNDNSTCNCNPGEAPRICASERSDGILVAHEKCNKFYTCSLGKPITIKCPVGLFYNPWDQVCDLPQKVECGDRIIPDPNDNAGSEDSDNGDVDTDDSGSNNNSNENGNNSNNDNGSGSCNCNPGEAPQICAEARSDGVLVAHEKCNKFYTCSLGKPVTVRCPSDFLYNPQDQVCDWPQNVECGDRVIPEKGSEVEDNNGDNDNGISNDNTDNGNDDNGNGSDSQDDQSQAAIICAAIGSDGVLIAHKNCNQFYLCSEGKPVVLDCALNLLYNPATKQCDWPENVQCGNGVLPGQETKENEIEGKGNREYDDDGDANDTYDSGIDGEAVAICSVAQSHGMFVPHANCNQFYVCIENRPAVQTCAANLLYNMETRECTWPQNVNCGDRFDPRSLVTALNKHFASRRSLKYQTFII